MNDIERYAMKLVVEGAEKFVQEDLNEDDELDDEDWREACKLAVKIARTIWNNPEAVLALVKP
jgi:hypothetical protein